MRDMICPRCNNPLTVERQGRVIVITCNQCKFASDVATNVRAAQQEFFENVSFMDSIDKLRDWIKRNT